MGSRFSNTFGSIPNKLSSPSTSPRSSSRPPSPVLDTPSDVSFYYRGKMFWSYFDTWMSSKEGAYFLFVFREETAIEKLQHTRNKEEVYSIFSYLHSILSKKFKEVHLSKSCRHPLLYWRENYTGKTFPEYNTAISNYRLFDSAGCFYQTCSDLLRYIPSDYRKDKEVHREAAKETIYYSKLAHCCYTISDQYSNCSVVIETLNNPKYQSLGDQIRSYTSDLLIEQEPSILMILCRS